MRGLFGSVGMLIEKPHLTFKVMASDREQTVIFLKQGIPPIDLNIRSFNNTRVLTDNPITHQADKHASVTGAREKD